MQRPPALPTRLPHPAWAFKTAIVILIASCGIWLAMHHPLSPMVAIGIFMLIAIVANHSPLLALPCIPTCTVLIGFAPWTGWITFEELDIVLLAIAAGGYAGQLWRQPSQPIIGEKSRYRAVGVWIALFLFAASTLVAMMRGFADAGGFTFGWFQGYHEPMNSVRLAKSQFLALLLLPLWQTIQHTQPDRSARALSVGMAAGLTAATMAVVWERAAFTDLLNFSADYRTTALFWEMHVGGAALDGFLALTMPFAVRELLRARTPWKSFLAAAMTAAGGYACLTTFSRGVYLAIPVGLAAMFLLMKLQARRARGNNRQGTQSASDDGIRWTASIPVVTFGMGVALLFPTSGYRGVLALMGVFFIMLPLVPLLRSLRFGMWPTSVVAGLLVAAALAGAAELIPKGPYLMYGLSLAFCSAMLVVCQRRLVATKIAQTLALAAFFSTVILMVQVAWHWGGPLAIWPAVTMGIAGCALLVAAAVANRPFWPGSIRRQAGLSSVMVMLFAITAVFSAGDYMGSRFSTVGNDLQGRIAHWKQGASMLMDPADWILGKGSGRYPANHFLIGDPGEHPGDYRLRHEVENNYVRLTGGLHTNGWGEVFRLSQRVEVPGRQPILRARVRTPTAITLSFEICEKHLLYNRACLIKPVHLPAVPGQWQNIKVELDGDVVTGGEWYAPKLIAFSIAMSTRGGEADLDNISLIRDDGRELLSNGGFDDDLARWFFSSDKHHLPWHIKSVFMHVVFDQGIVGLLLWSLLLIVALTRLTAGQSKDHPLAPAVAASLLGFTTVGLFDSLLDVPRVATIYYWMLGVALMMKLPRRQGPLPA